MRIEKFLESLVDMATPEVEVCQLEGILVSDGIGFYVSTEDIDSYRKKGIAINDDALLPRLGMGISGFGGGSYCDMSAVVVSGKVIKSIQGLGLSAISLCRCFPHREEPNYKLDFYPDFPLLPNEGFFVSQVSEAVDDGEASLVGFLTFKKKTGLLSYKVDPDRIESVVVECEALDSRFCEHFSPQGTWPTWKLPVQLKCSIRSTRKRKCLGFVKEIKEITALDVRIGMSLTLDDLG